MKQQKLSIYKYVLTAAGWRYKRAAIGSNHKPKPNVVIVGKDANGKDIEEVHPEGNYYLGVDGGWLWAFSYR